MKTVKNETTNLEELIKSTCQLYKIETIFSFYIMENGYDDLNIFISTNQGNFVAKFFSDSKSDRQCQNYLYCIQQVIHIGVNHPSLHTLNQNGFSVIEIKSSPNRKYRVFLMSYIESGNIYQSNYQLNQQELKDLVQQVALLHKVSADFVISSDSWAVVDFPEIYKQKHHFLESRELPVISNVLDEYLKINLSVLPYRFIHGDIVKTNLIKKTRESLYIIDFSAAGYYPRIQELAVLLSNVFFDETNSENTQSMHTLLLDEYQKMHTLTPYELQVLPIFVKAAHCINILCPLYEKVVLKNLSPENEYWLKLGRMGIASSTNL